MKTISVSITNATYFSIPIQIITAMINTFSICITLHFRIKLTPHLK